MQRRSHFTFGSSNCLLHRHNNPLLCLSNDHRLQLPIQNGYISNHFQTKITGPHWRERIIVRTPCVAIFYLLLKPKIVYQWTESLQESYKLDILFTVFKDIPQLIASILLATGTNGLSFFCRLF